MKYTERPEGPCKLCRRRMADQWHHRFPQYKSNRETYGKLLDEPFNLVPVCADCHASHASLEAWARWSEKDFRDNAAAKGYTLPKPKKSFKG